MNKNHFKKHIVAILILALVSFCGCFRQGDYNQSDDNGDEKLLTENDTKEDNNNEVTIYEIKPLGGEIIQFIPMVKEENSGQETVDKKQYSYLDDEMNIKLSYAVDNPGEIVVNGKKLTLQSTANIYEGTPKIYITDINKDNKKDIIISWRGWRLCKIIVFLSDGNSYVEAVPDNNVEDLDITFLDGFKMNVVSKEYNFNKEFNIASYYKDLLVTDNIYDKNGDCLNKEYKISTKNPETAQIECYKVNGEIIIAEKLHILDGSYSTGVSIVCYYKAEGNSLKKQQTLIVNENWSLY